MRFWCIFHCILCFLLLKNFLTYSQFHNAFCNHKVLTFLSFLTFLFTIFNNSLCSTYVYNFYIVSFHVIWSMRGLCDKQCFTNFLTVLPNCSVGVTVAVDKYVNNSIYFFGSYDFLWFTLDLYILRPLKCLNTFGSIKSIETTNSMFLWVSFLILFFHVFVKHKRDLWLKYILVVFVFLSSKFYLSTYDDIVYNNVKLCNRLQFYSPDYIRTCNVLHEAC